ncbi:MAG: hypothetical protein M9939_10340 [Mesorhizobium sp.]|nr:hypothetical protein [Mesorhizobium sp.]MCO5161525.1 hypothetical protein [Mesorhizobium sp.]
MIEARRIACGGLVWAALAAQSFAQDKDVSTVDIARFFACDAAARDYNGFAMEAAMDPAVFEALGWTETGGGNPFLREFRLPAPIYVFDREVSTVALTATGPMAVIEDADPRDIARKLSVTPVVDTPEKYLGERVVSEVVETDGGAEVATRVSLNVATVESHPGQVLAGCSYSVEVR